MNTFSTLLKPLLLLIVISISVPFFGQSKFKENRLYLGEYDFDKKRYKEAIDNFNYVIEHNPSHRAYYLRGLAKYNLGDKVGAEIDFTEAIKRRNNKVDYYIIRGATRALLLENQQAFKDFEKAIELDKTNEYVYLNRAIAFINLKKYSEVIADCNLALKYHSKKALIYSLRGQAQIGLKNYDQAISDFNLLIKSDPSESDYYTQRSFAYYYLEKYELALTDVRKAIRLDDQNSEAYFKRAIIFDKLGKKEEALKDLNKVLELSPNSTSAYFNRALIYTDIEEYNKALKDYEKVIMFNSKNILAYYNRAIIYNRLKKIKLARLDVEKIIEIYPDFVDAYKLRASLKQQIGDYIGAKQDKQTAKIINNTKLNITDSLKRNEELNIAKVTSFSNSYNKNVEHLSNNEIALITPYYISLLSSSNRKRIIDSWNKKNNSYSAYFLLNGNEDINESLKLKKLEAINEKILLDFNNGELYLKRAIVNASLNIYERAILDFNKSLHLDTDNYMAYFGKANMLYQIITKDETSNYSLDIVIKEYDKCITLNPKFTYAYFNRAYLKFLKENYIGAIEDYSKAISLSPSFAEAYFNRALILLILENNDQACKDLSKAGELGITKGYSLIGKYCSK